MNLMNDSDLMTVMNGVQHDPIFCKLDQDGKIHGIYGIQDASFGPC